LGNDGVGAEEKAVVHQPSSISHHTSPTPRPPSHEEERVFKLGASCH
jgi:hypothetical protein